MRKQTKFGIAVPKDVMETKKFDEENRSNLWDTAIKKPFSFYRITKKNKKPQPGRKLINYHFVFDIKMDLTQKARLVAGGHLNKDVPRHVTYSFRENTDKLYLYLQH